MTHVSCHVDVYVDGLVVVIFIVKEQPMEVRYVVIDENFPINQDILPISNIAFPSLLLNRCCCFSSSNKT